jgi:hypothetical protein
MSNCGLKLGSKRCVGRTKTDRKITGEPWSSTLGQKTRRMTQARRGVLGVGARAVQRFWYG